MELNNLRKKELRKNILEQLKNIPEGERIRLDKKLLEDLLFEEIVLVESKGLTAKLPVWSGNFLRKIDLSEVSFENVSWSLCHVSYPVEGSEKLSDEEQEEVREKLTELNDKNKNYMINYSYTNANIDLTQSFECKFDKHITLDHCNFAGINFANQDLSVCKSLTLVESNISDSKINIPLSIKLWAEKSDLSNVNLAGRKINGVNAVVFEDEYLFNDCNLSNTGVEIDFDIIEYTNLIEQYNNSALEFNKKLVEAKNKNWVGCFVNGKKIEKHLSKEEEELEQRRKETPEKFFVIGQREYEIMTSFDSPFNENERFIIYTNNKLTLKGHISIFFGKYDKSIGLKPIDAPEGFDPVEPLENEHELHFVEKTWLGILYDNDEEEISKRM